MLCVALLLTQVHRHTQSKARLTHTHTAYISVVQPGDTELSAFYSSQPTVMGLIPPPSLSPSGCLLMRDAVKCMGTVSSWLKCSSGAFYGCAILLVLRPTFQTQILHSSFLWVVDLYCFPFSGSMSSEGCNTNCLCTVAELMHNPYDPRWSQGG